MADFLLRLQCGPERLFVGLCNKDMPTKFHKSHCNMPQGLHFLNVAGTATKPFLPHPLSKQSKTNEFSCYLVIIALLLQHVFDTGLIALQKHLFFISGHNFFQN